MALMSRIVPKTPKVALSSQNDLFLLKIKKGWYLKKFQKNRMKPEKTRRRSFGLPSTFVSIEEIWQVRDSNPRPSACQT